MGHDDRHKCLAVEPEVDGSEAIDSNNPDMAESECCGVMNVPSECSEELKNNSVQIQRPKPALAAVAENVLQDMPMVIEQLSANSVFFADNQSCAVLGLSLMQI